MKNISFAHFNPFIVSQNTNRKKKKPQKANYGLVDCYEANILLTTTQVKIEFCQLPHKHFHVPWPSDKLLHLSKSNYYPDIYGNYFLACLYSFITLIVHF